MVKQGSKRFRIIAHRCRGYGEEENSLAALRKALASDVDEVEIDIQLTQDSHYILSHDPSYQDATGRRHIIAQETLATAKRNGRASLEEALLLFKRHGKGKRLDLDVKRRGNEKEIVRLIRKHRLERRILLVSWSGHVLEEAHRLAPELTLSYSFVPKLEADYRDARLFWYTFFLPKLIRKRILPLAVINLRNLLWPVSRGLVRRLHERGYEVIVVNADSVKENERLRSIGVDGSMTNRAREIIDELSRDGAYACADDTRR